jgi:hypothetical protein
VCAESQPLSGLRVDPLLFVLDDIQCSGDEVSLLNCSSNPLGEHDCGQSSGAGVQCQGKGIRAGCKYLWVLWVYDFPLSSC